MAPLNSYLIIFFFKTQSVNNNIFKLKIKKMFMHTKQCIDNNQD